MDELDKALAELEPKVVEEKKTPVPTLPTEEAKKIEEELRKKSEQLENLNKAVAEVNETLKKARAAKKEIKVEEEELPTIDPNDPSVKAWDKRFAGKVDPLASELEKEKEEVRTFALKEFLADKPALSKNPEKVKELVGMYEKIRTASERNKEGVLLDLDKAYAATHHEELLQIARNRRVDAAQADALLSDIAVSRGATSYNQERTVTRQYTPEERKIIERWGGSVEEQSELEQKYK